MIRQSITGATCQTNNALVNYALPKEHPRVIIEKLRLDRKIRSVRALAIQAGIPQPSLARYLNGSSETMEVQSFQALAQVLGVTLSELLGEVPLGSSLVAREVQQLAGRMDEQTWQRWLRVGKALLDDDGGMPPPS